MARIFKSLASWLGSVWGRAAIGSANSQEQSKKEQATSPLEPAKARTANDFRIRVLLSANRALLCEVFPALRQVNVEWSDKHIKLWAYIDGEIQDEDAESISCAETEIMADFAPEIEVTSEVVRCDFPERIPQDYAFDCEAIYSRREDW